MFEDTQVRGYLELALKKAEEAFIAGNYPIGAVFVDSTGQILAEEMNRCTTTHDLTAHAEIVGLRRLGEAASKDSTTSTYLFTSLEPCYGCSFFIARSSVKAIYSALTDPHKGGISNLQSDPTFADFFTAIQLINEPFEDLKEQSRVLMERYFLQQGNLKAAAHYQL